MHFQLLPPEEGVYLLKVQSISSSEVLKVNVVKQSILEKFISKSTQNNTVLF